MRIRKIIGNATARVWLIHLLIFRPPRLRRFPQQKMARRLMDLNPTKALQIHIEHCAQNRARVKILAFSIHEQIKPHSHITTVRGGLSFAKYVTMAPLVSSTFLDLYRTPLGR